MNTRMIDLILSKHSIIHIHSLHDLVTFVERVGA